MAKGKQDQDQLSALFSQRFKDQDTAPVEKRAAKAPTQKRGRPPKAVQRKTVSFFLLPKVAEQLDGRVLSVERRFIQENADKSRRIPRNGA